MLHLLPDHTRSVLSLTSQRLNNEYIDEDRIRAFSILLETIVKIYDVLPPLMNKGSYKKDLDFKRTAVQFRITAKDRRGKFTPLVQRKHLQIQNGVNVKEYHDFDYTYHIKVTHDVIQCWVQCTSGSYLIFHTAFDKFDFYSLRFFLYGALPNDMDLQVSASVDCEAEGQTSYNHFIYKNTWGHLRGDWPVPNLPPSVFEFSFDQYVSNLAPSVIQQNPYPNTPGIRHARYVYDVLQSLKPIITKTTTYKPLMKLIKGYNPHSHSKKTPSSRG